MTWLLIGALVTVGTTVFVRYRRARRARVTPAWLIDNDRRAWTVGVDQVGIAAWPIRRD